MYLCFEDKEENLEGTFDTGGKGGGSLKCEMDAVSVKFPGRFCLRYIPEHSYICSKHTVATPVRGWHITERAFSFNAVIEEDSASLIEEEEDVNVNLEDVMWEEYG